MVLVAAKLSPGQMREDFRVLRASLEEGHPGIYRYAPKAEIDEALRAISRLRLPVPERRTRRYQAAHRGNRVDFRASLRRALRPEGLVELRKRTPRRRLQSGSATHSL